MSYKVTNIQKAQKEHYYVTSGMCSGLKNNKGVFTELMDQFHREIFHWGEGYSKHKNYTPTFHNDSIDKIRDELNSYSEFKGYSKAIKDIISSQIFFEHFVLNVGGAAVMTPYIKGIYDYTIDSVYSVFSSEEQDL